MGDNGNKSVITAEFAFQKSYQRVIFGLFEIFSPSSSESSVLYLAITRDVELPI